MASYHHTGSSILLRSRSLEEYYGALRIHISTTNATKPKSCLIYLKDLDVSTRTCIIDARGAGSYRVYFKEDCFQVESKIFQFNPKPNDSPSEQLQKFNYLMTETQRDCQATARKDDVSSVVFLRQDKDFGVFYVRKFYYFVMEQASFPSKIEDMISHYLEVRKRALNMMYGKVESPSIKTPNKSIRSLRRSSSSSISDTSGRSLRRSSSSSISDRSGRLFRRSSSSTIDDNGIGNNRGRDGFVQRVSSLVRVPGKKLSSAMNIRGNKSPVPQAQRQSRAA